MRTALYSSITHGKLIRYLCYEHTRFRKKPKNGDRFLKNSSNIFDFNTWDNVEWTEDQKKLAEEAVQKNGQVTFSKEQLEAIETQQATKWDDFYGIHQNKFFKDRHWLFTEFPELVPNKSDAPERVYPESAEIVNKMSSMQLSSGGRKVFEIGSGVGNTIFPILRYSNEEDLMVYASDFSSEAIKILKESPEFDSKRCNAFVLDATADDWEVPFEENSLDIVVLIFVLSAIHPEKYQGIVEKLFKYLKKGGLVLFRDYGRFDLAQLRFKKGKCLQDNFYLRNDGTRCFFFTQEEIRDLFTSKGFIEEFNAVDRRLQVNRGKMLKMYRIWIQSKFRKPLD